MFQSVSVSSLYNPLFQRFETPEMGPGIFTFSRACFNCVSKRFETTETFGLSLFCSCFSLFQFFPYIIHCFSVSKHQKWGLVFLPFPELVSVLFRNVSKQLKRLDLVNFLPVSVYFSFFPIQSSRVITIIFTTETSTSDGISLGTDLFLLKFTIL